MVAVIVIAMVMGASVVGVRALTAKRAGGVARLSGGMASVKYSAKRANGAITYLKVRENDYQRAYHCGHDPPAGDRHLGRRAEAQVEPVEAAERSARCLRRECCRRDGDDCCSMKVRLLCPVLCTWSPCAAPGMEIPDIDR
jgi:hypothetical protein